MSRRTRKVLGVLTGVALVAGALTVWLLYSVAERPVRGRAGTGRRRSPGGVRRWTPTASPSAAACGSRGWP